MVRMQFLKHTEPPMCWRKRPFNTEIIFYWLLAKFVFLVGQTSQTPTLYWLLFNDVSKETAF